MLGSTGSGKTVAAKILIEEATISGIPSVIIDPQGDLARLALMGDRKTVTENGGDADRSRLYEEKAEVRIWTPTSTKGLPICLDPFCPPTGEQDPSKLVNSWDLMAAGFTILAGHDVEKKSSGGQVKAFLYQLLTESAIHGMLPFDFVTLSELVSNPMKMVDEGAEADRVTSIVEGYIKEPVRLELARRFNALDSGVNQLLFTLGVPLDIDILTQPSKKGKTPVNIIYLNSLSSEDTKNSFLQEFGRRLYDWTLHQKSESDDTKLLFFIDEVAPYLPPEPRRPPAKDIIKLLFKQGRKFGLSCVLATQNVSDVDYKILGQANTIFIGRFQTKQDRNKVSDLLKVGKSDLSLVEELPNLKAGEFQLVCPDVADIAIPVQTRWLYTDHGPALSENEVEKLIGKDLRDWASSHTTSYSQPKLPPAIPMTRQQISKGMEAQEVPFESHLMGGLMLLKDSKDPLSVMLGMTNLLTAITLLLTTIVLGQSWVDGDNSGFMPLLGAVVSLTACVALVIETFLADDIMMVQRIRKRARPIQYLILAWIWFLWFANRADMIELGSLKILVDICQTVTTLFVVLEFAHRLQLAKVSLQLDWNPIFMMKESVHNLKMILSKSELAVMRATSTQVMKSLQQLTEFVTLVILGILVSGISDISQDSLIYNEIAVRLFTVYALQIAARAFVNIRDNQ